MDIQRLRTLRELSIRGTMAAVAEVIALSPSAVSQQISLLEEEAGIALIERKGRGVTITPAGQVLVEHATKLLTVLEEAKAELAAMKNVVCGTLVVSSFPSMAAMLVGKSIRSLQLSYPELIVSAVEMEALVGLASLRSWQVDVAIVDDLTLKKDNNPQTLEIFPIYEDRIVGVFNKDHPLSSKTELELADLRNEFWAVDTRPNTFSDTLFSMCARRGFEPRIIGRFDAFEVISSMVAEGSAISIMPQVRTLLDGDELVCRQFDPPIKRSIFLAIRKGELKRVALNALVQTLREVAAEIPSTESAIAGTIIA